MTEQDWLGEQFEAHRAHMESVAYRILGARDDAEDAVQEAWLRLSRSDAATIENLGGWLTTVVSRISLDVLRRKRTRPADAIGDHLSDEAVDPDAVTDPEQEAILAESIGAALLVVLDTLSPAERLTVVLHDMFAMPFDEIAAILGRSPGATKKLASRARQKLQGSPVPPDVDLDRQRAVVGAFLAAAREGRFESLVSMLDPEIVLVADAGAVELGSPETVAGRLDVAAVFSGRALGAKLATIDGSAGMVWIVQGRTKVVWEFTVVDDAVAHISMLATPGTLDDLDIVVT